SSSGTAGTGSTGSSSNSTSRGTPEQSNGTLPQPRSPYAQINTRSNTGSSSGSSRSGLSGPSWTSTSMPNENTRTQATSSTRKSSLAPGVTGPEGPRDFPRATFSVSISRGGLGASNAHASDSVRAPVFQSGIPATVRFNTFGYESQSRTRSMPYTTSTNS